MKTKKVITVSKHQTICLELKYKLYIEECNGTKSKERLNILSFIKGFPVEIRDYLTKSLEKCTILDLLGELDLARAIHLNERELFKKFSYMSKLPNLLRMPLERQKDALYPSSFYKESYSLGWKGSWELLDKDIINFYKRSKLFLKNDISKEDCKRILFSYVISILINLQNIQSRVEDVYLLGYEEHPLLDKKVYPLYEEIYNELYSFEFTSDHQMEVVYPIDATIISDKVNEETESYFINLNLREGIRNLPINHEIIKNYTEFTFKNYYDYVMSTKTIKLELDS